MKFFVAGKSNYFGSYDTEAKAKEANQIAKKMLEDNPPQDPDEAERLVERIHEAIANKGIKRNNRSFRVAEEDTGIIKRLSKTKSGVYTYVSLSLVCSSFDMFLLIIKDSLLHINIQQVRHYYAGKE